MSDNESDTLSRVSWLRSKTNSELCVQRTLQQLSASVRLQDVANGEELHVLSGKR